MKVVGRAKVMEGGRGKAKAKGRAKAGVT